MQQIFRAFCLSPRAAKLWAGRDPKRTVIASIFEQTKDVINSRRRIVRQMQIDNLTNQKGNKS